MKTRAIVVGAGRFGREHIRRIYAIKNTSLVGIVEVNENEREETRRLFAKLGVPCPPFYETVGEFLANNPKADAAVIVTPHACHLEHALTCLNAGMDVLIEKPMVLNVAEARRLIRARDRSGRTVMVAYPGSLSEAIHRARQWVHEGRIGRVSAISAHLHERWKANNIGTWRQVPEISGGGFLFDTGSHLVNTMLDLLDSDVVEVSAFLDRASTPVEITSVVSGKFRNGVLFSLCAAGDSILCDSLLRVFGDCGILETGAWGSFLRIRTAEKPEWKDIPLPRRRPLWEIFLNVRAGRQPNPCPAEVGLRFARFMDMVRRSAHEGRAICART